METLVAPDRSHQNKDTCIRARVLHRSTNRFSCDLSIRRSVNTSRSHFRQTSIFPASFMTLLIWAPRSGQFWAVHGHSGFCLDLGPHMRGFKNTGTKNRNEILHDSTLCVDSVTIHWELFQPLVRTRSCPDLRVFICAPVC